MWKLLFGESASPDNDNFKYFKNSLWETIDLTGDVMFLTVEGDWEQRKRDEVVTYLTHLLTSPNRKQQLPRGDYKEIAEITLYLLGASVPGGFSFKRPAGCHKARWGPIILYSAKIFLLQLQLDMDDEGLVLLTRQVKYNSLVYVVPWLSASIGADAPYNDLKLYKTLLEFSNIDPPVAEVAIKFLNNHLWYLTQVNILVY